MTSPDPQTRNMMGIRSTVIEDFLASLFMFPNAILQLDMETELIVNKPPTKAERERAAEAAAEREMDEERDAILEELERRSEERQKQLKREAMEVFSNREEQRTIGSAIRKREEREAEARRQEAHHIIPRPAKNYVATTGEQKHLVFRVRPVPGKKANRQRSSSM